ncbi:MAG: hypothetical protein M3680_15435, partial [Myxococcota bacterium]|nr:hypothetical protein [Myxococcota bacterium]
AAPASAAEPAARAQPVPSPAMAKLIAEVEQLPTSRADRSHAAVAGALRALSEVVRGLDGTSSERGDRIAAAADDVDQQERQGLHTRAVARGLGEALGALDDVMPQASAGAQRDHYVAAVRALERLAVDEPLLPQAARVHLAFSAIVDGLAIVQGIAAPFGTSVAPREHRPDPAAFAEHLERASRHVLAAAAARSWTDARASTAQALLAIADAVSSGPVRAGELATVIRFEAFRLARATPIDQRRVDWAKAGLVTAAAALQDAIPPTSAVVLALARHARQAADAIDANATFAFQRPAIQDALRAVFEAYSALGLDDPTWKPTATR